MTLPETMNKENIASARRLKTLTISLTASMRQAVRRRGCVRGMSACTELLKKDSSSVMLCILPINCTVGVDIQQTLIKAFCQESGIAVILVDSCDKLSKLVGKLETNLLRQQQEGRQSPSSDAHCLIIKHPKKDASKQDNSLLEFYHEMSWKHQPQPVLALPD